MELAWYGGSCCFIKGGDLAILTNPPAAPAGKAPRLPAADVILLSGAAFAPALSYAPAKRKALRNPGEFEIGGIMFSGIKTFREPTQGAPREPNIVYRFPADGLRVCHLGELVAAPSAEQAAAIGPVDILLLAIGEGGMPIAGAAETVRLIEPRVIVPLLLDPKPGDLAARFLKELAMPSTGPTAKLSLTKSTLPPEPQVVLLERAA
ncbi:MAG: hypothetical protein EXR49_03710 [Dehalococcoidia bacterium]|nr:hypothetical protein [Dehalococcoidia bacterium]